jgi:hypothetical protein
MDLPSYDDALRRSADKPAFSNGTEADCWMENYCYRCKNDGGAGCPLVLVVVGENRTPAEWQPDQPGSLGRQYTCALFSPLA